PSCHRRRIVPKRRAHSTRALPTCRGIHYDARDKKPERKEETMAGNASGVPVVADLGAIVKWLDRHGRLVRVRSEIDPAYELAGIAARFEGSPRAVLFERVKGSRYPVLTGLYWSRELLGALLGRPERTLPQYVSQCIRDWQQRPDAPVAVDPGPGPQAPAPRVDLSKLPLPGH